MIFTGKRFVAIIDGATSKSKTLFDGRTGGWSAANIVNKSLAKIENLDLFNHLDSEYKICDFITEQFDSFYTHFNVNYIKEPRDRIVASAIIYDHYFKKIIMIGDCQAVIIDKNKKETLLINEKPIDNITSNARSLYIQSAITSKEHTVESLMNNDLGREYIEPLLRDQLLFQNQDIEYGYGCFDGTLIPKKLIKTFSIQDIERIILSSDGYPSLFSSLSGSEKNLHYILKNDPLMFILHKTTKGLSPHLNSFDDRSYISFNI